MPELLMKGGDDGLQHAERINNVLAERCSYEIVNMCDVGWRTG